MEEQALRAYHRRTLAADGLIAKLLPGLYQHAAGAPRPQRSVCWRHRQGHGGREWRKVKSSWDTWKARSLAEEPIMRLSAPTPDD